MGDLDSMLADLEEDMENLGVQPKKVPEGKTCLVPVIQIKQ